jgi:hypothetical protein
MIQTCGPFFHDSGSNGEITIGKALVHDGVANLVAVDLPVGCSPFKERLYYAVWDDTNRMHRRVASGVYLLATSVRYMGTPATTVPVKANFGIYWQ